MTHPLQVLASIDSAQEAGAISDFRAQMLRATVYYNPLQEDAKAIECARDALSMNTEELTDRNRILFSNSWETAIIFPAIMRKALMLPSKENM